MGYLYILLPINSNIRCIETKLVDKEYSKLTRINSNIRCIETPSQFLALPYPPRLIVIYDVLKPRIVHDVENQLTINSNIRCIETYHNKK